MWNERDMRPLKWVQSYVLPQEFAETVVRNAEKERKCMRVCEGQSELDR